MLHFGISYYWLWRVVSSGRWRQYVTPKHRWNSTGLHGVTSQKIILLKFNCLTLHAWSEYVMSGQSNGRSQWPRGLRHEMPSPAFTLGSWVRIPLEAWMFAFILSVLSRVGSGLATGWSLVQGILPTVYKCKITEPHKEEVKARYGLERHIRRRRRQSNVINKNLINHLKTEFLLNTI
jgi:hypothetical protein